MAQPATSADIPTWTLGDRLRKARDHAGLKQTELAERTGISRGSIVRYERDEATPSRPMLLAWAFATGVRLDWFRSDDDPENTPRRRKRRGDIKDSYPRSAKRPTAVRPVSPYPPNGRRPRRLSRPPS